ncbi:hypothetical protein [Humisphaera borealis]|uniref:Uncharacterized protein n=1 Tax=Humisphaera borealis TaxID=2807512 RepID=A0A7M2X1P8_9BACT|nr:hypothetical protein [Humisphaera borealis]QOV91061.1 hypothetical protein IPV69_06795 [Humisphaera borealis]
MESFLDLAVAVRDEATEAARKTDPGSPERIAQIHRIGTMVDEDMRRALAMAPPHVYRSAVMDAASIVLKELVATQRHGGHAFIVATEAVSNAVNVAMHLPPPTPTPAAPDDLSGGIEPDPEDGRVVRVAGCRVYLGSDTNPRRLFDTLAKQPGRKIPVDDATRAVDGFETSETQGSDPDEIRKARQRVHKAVNKIREALAEHGAGAHLALSHEDNSYALLWRASR